MSSAADPDPVPPYLSPRDVKDACPQLSEETVSTDLENAGLLQRFSPKSHYRISSSALRERLPDYYDRVYLLFLSRSAEFQTKTRRTPVNAGKSG